MCMHMYHRHIPLTLLDLVFSFCDPSNLFFFDDSHSFPTAAHTQTPTDTDTHTSLCSGRCLTTKNLYRLHSLEIFC